MKRVTYFVSAVAPSSDILAAELVLTLKEKYPHATPYGIAGPSMRRAGIQEIASLESCAKSGILQMNPVAASARIQEATILEGLGRVAPRVAILVGYSAFHKRLADQLSLRQIPVILYGAPNISAWPEREITELRRVVTKVMGVYPFELDLYTDYGFDYSFVGSPHKDRAGKVMVSRRALGFPADATIVALLPGSRVSDFERLFPLMMAVKDAIKDELERALFVLPLSPGLTLDDVLRIAPGAEPPVALGRERGLGELAGLQFAGVQIMHGMSLEIMGLADVALVSSGTATLECALLGTPHVAIDARPHDFRRGGQRVYGAMVNEVASRRLVEELDVTTPVETIARSVLRLARKTDERRVMLEEFDSLKRILKGFAAENAAEIVGQFIGQWRNRRRS